MEINPFDLDPYELREEFANFLEEIKHTFFSQMYDVQGDITYILHHHYHPQNMSNIHSEVVTYLTKNGLKKADKPLNNKEKANSDYYLAAYYGLETCDNFFKNYESMDYYSLLSNFSYAKSQLAILEVLSSTGEPRHKMKDTSGQTEGAIIANTGKYKQTRERAIVEWVKYKKTLIEWEKFQANPNQYEKEIHLTLKAFDKLFCNILTGIPLKGANIQTQELLKEKYTDSVQIPPLAIGWIKEFEGLPNKHKELANKRRKERKIAKLMENSPFSTLDVQLRRMKNK